MRIEYIPVRQFSYTAYERRDTQGHEHDCEPYQSRMALLTIAADDGSEGHCVALTALPALLWSLNSSRLRGS